MSYKTEIITYKVFSSGLQYIIISHVQEMFLEPHFEVYVFIHVDLYPSILGQVWALNK